MGYNISVLILWTPALEKHIDEIILLARLRASNPEGVQIVIGLPTSAVTSLPAAPGNLQAGIRTVYLDPRLNAPEAVEEMRCHAEAPICFLYVRKRTKFFSTWDARVVASVHNSPFYDQEYRQHWPKDTVVYFFKTEKQTDITPRLYA